MAIPSIAIRSGGSGKAGKPKFNKRFLRYPNDIDKAIAIQETRAINENIYFAPFLLTNRKRIKANIVDSYVAWADGDECSPKDLIIPPSVVIRTSEHRYSYLWKFKALQSATIAEEVSKAIAYAHLDFGMDKSGWDLTQLLRFPGTYNHKYHPPQSISRAYLIGNEYSPQDIYEVIPKELIRSKGSTTNLGEVTLPQESAEKLLNKYTLHMSSSALDLFHEEPDSDDWSKNLWNLELYMLEAGASVEETFVIAEASSCNKYRRDNRNKEDLWKEVNRANGVVKESSDRPPELTTLVESPVIETGFYSEDEIDALLSDDERIQVEKDKTFVEDYVDWANRLGDASIQYHPTGAFTILSSLLSSNVELPTSFGVVKPNLWFIVLANTTLTRKSTAMDLAVELLLDVDKEALLATDGSTEGLIQGLSTRPKRSSLFLRDEFTGLVESFTKKDYMSGMMETLTKMYDGKPIKRVLKNETIEVRDPVFILYAGGILNKMTEILDYRHVSSGFIPRFIIVTAEADINKIQPVGPPTKQDTSGRSVLLHHLMKLQSQFRTKYVSNDGQSISHKKSWEAKLTDEAWKKYNKFEYSLLRKALSSGDASLTTPSFDRLSKSGLKVAVLIAASRLDPERIDNENRELTVTELDMLHSFYYIERWRRHTEYILNNIGTTPDERQLQQVLGTIINNPGINRSALMRKHNMTAKSGSHLFTTLEQRGLIKKVTTSRGPGYFSSDWKSSE